ncbi:uncharacterized protein [Haliotis asinina]|uniref:uncharacterized protein n=1 Tax=Haliotis asinina TaxID=109174 RepID=UPI0035320190
MPSVNPFSILQTQRTYLQKHLQLKGTHLLDYLLEKNVITPRQLEDIEDIPQTSKKISKLLTLLMKRPPHEFEHFMTGLEGEQDHVKDHLQGCLDKVSSEENCNIDVEMEEDPESMDEFTENDCGDDTDDESVESDSEEDIGQPLKLIKEFKMDPEEQDVTLHVKVMKVGQVEEKSNKRQFMATVADATSAVDICVREETLFDKFKLEGCIILRNVTWTGRILFTKPSSTATFAMEFRVPKEVTANAFGTGDPVTISKVCSLPDMSWFKLRGKIVKQSPLTKRKCFGKVLSYCQVKLKDDTGSVYVDVWGDIAEQMQLGKVVEVGSCKKRQTSSPDDPCVTTTTKSSVKFLTSTLLKQIQKDRRYQRGTLVGTDVTLYMSCPNPRCFRYQLTDGQCESCLRQIPDRDQLNYGVASIDILTQKGNIHSLTVYWTQLLKFFRLFKKTQPGRDKEKIVKTFNDLWNKTVKFQACGIVSKFKL